jgi:hypothetical protein
MISDSNTSALSVFAVSNQYTKEDNLKKPIILGNMPSYKTINTLDDKKMTIDILKQFAKLFNLKTSGKKQILIERIKQYLTHTHFITFIQKIFRGYIQRKVLHLRGPTLYKRMDNVNACDFLTLEPIEEISYYQYFSFLDTDGIKYGFDISSIYHLFYNDNHNAKNPYNRNLLKVQIYETIQNIIRISKIYKHVNVKIDLETYQVSNEKRIQLRIIDLFQTINETGNYSDFKWYERLNRIKLFKFMYEIIDIWEYRANLTIEDKISICPPDGRPFNGIPQILTILKTQNITCQRLKEIILTVLEKFVYDSFSTENKGIRVMYILTALTTVSREAAECMPWLYESIH